MDDQCSVCGEYTVVTLTILKVIRFGRKWTYAGDTCYHCMQVLDAMCSQMSISEGVRRRARQLRLLAPAPA